MNASAPLWADSRLVYAVATAAVALLLATVWLLGRRKRQGRQAGVICLGLSIILHAALLILVPILPSFSGGAVQTNPPADTEIGSDTVEFASFDPDMEIAAVADDSDQPAIEPLPVADLLELAASPPAEPPAQMEPKTNQALLPQSVPDVLAGTDTIGSALEELLDNALDASAAEPTAVAATAPEPPSQPDASDGLESVPAAGAVAAVPAALKTVPGELENDFANRNGAAKQQAIANTGGDADTEAAVAAALRFLASSQRADGAWDPRASGAGVERSPLGLSRGGAGARAETAITGLALLSMLGAGNTHQQGDYADNVYRGLVYLMGKQKPDGSLAGNAAVYASTYSHGMAALAVCEAAAITGDPAATESAARAIGHTRRMQHPSSGGWRYLQGDPGDLSQLGWQAMVLDAGYRAKLSIDPKSVHGINRFLHSVRQGRFGGLASYRPGERASPTMTAEALATRLLIGQNVSQQEIDEAEQYLLQHPPGVGQDNYYYWYYATLALHQLQDQAWRRWNEALKARLLATQRADGSWPADSLWGGYGGTVYTTSMATLCLETYYRHAIRGNHDRLANQPGQTMR